MARRRQQYGCIRKRGKRNPAWELQYWEDALDVDGKLIRVQRTVRLGLVAEMTKPEAKRARDKFLAPVNAGKQIPQSTMTLAEFVERHFIPLAFPKLEISSQKHYRSDLALHILPAFGPSRLCDIGLLEIQQFIWCKSAGGLSWASVHHLRATLSRLYAAARKWGYFSGENPAAGVELPKKRLVREKHVLEPEAFRRLREALPEPSRTLVILGALTGMRIGEMLGLRWQDVDFSGEELRIEQAWKRGVMGGPKTEGSKAKLPLPPPLACALLRYRDAFPPVAEGELIFRSRHGRPLSDSTLLRRQLKPAGAKVGVGWINWHTLRRSHSTLLQTRQVGGTPRDAQAQLRHASLATTMGDYTLLIPDHQRQSAERLAELLMGAELALPKHINSTSLTVHIGGELAKTDAGLLPPTQQVQ